MAGEASKRHSGGVENSPRSIGSQDGYTSADQERAVVVSCSLSQGALAGLTLASTVSVAIRTAMAFDDPQIHRWFLTSPFYLVAGLWIDTVLTSKTKQDATSYACVGGFALIAVLFFLPAFFNMAFGIYSMLLSSPVLGDSKMKYSTRVKFMASGLLVNMATVALLLFLRWTMDSAHYTFVRRALLILSALIIPPNSHKRNEDQVLNDAGSGSDNLFEDFRLSWRRTLFTVLRSRKFGIWLITELILEALKVLWTSLAETQLLLLHKMFAALLVYLPMYFYGYKRIYQLGFFSSALLCAFTEIRGRAVSPRWIIAALLCGFQWAGYQLVLADLVSVFKKKNNNVHHGGYGATMLGIVAALRPFINMVRKIDVARDHLESSTLCLTCIQCIVWNQYDASSSRLKSPKRPHTWNLLKQSDHPSSHTV